jgi:uncharacterized protein
MDWLWITLGIILTLAGLAGSILPVLPGPPLNYLAILLIHFTGIYGYTDRFLISWLILTIIVLVLDYFIPIWGAQLSGGSRKGIWGATIGLVVGLVFFPPLGMIVWSFVGAIIGEMVAGKNLDLAIKAGTGTFIGFLAGTVAKFIVSLILTFFFFQGAF